MRSWGMVRSASEYLLDYLQGKRSIESIPGIGYLKDGSIRINPGECFFKNLISHPSSCL